MERAALEAEISAFREGGDLRGALEVALAGYGREISRFLLVRVGDPVLAADAYSQLTEDLWIGLPTFEGRSSFRTWMYVVARNAATRLQRSQRSESKRSADLSEVADLAERARSETLTFLRTESKERLAKLRKELEPLDEQLLMLRVTRGLEWNEVVAILEGSVELDSEHQRRLAARYRQRFRALKNRLKAELSG
ncbi:MAG: sigma-70 family RNA polymerase sigma factor [Polyangiaceae bacterium]|nr:sigma-70 family RNA polymerase sigma factor [Myxococcales bacterium]MCB9589321.1 sigma-70 family RNA polymerase sigma factor [Polyangiaceae bacterium]